MLFNKLEARKCPSLREGEVGPAPLPSPPPAFLVRALLALRRAILGIADALAPPELGIFDRVNGVAKTALLGFVARAGVADLLRSGPLSAEEIARRLDTHPDATFRSRERVAVTLLRAEDLG